MSVRTSNRSPRSSQPAPAGHRGRRRRSRSRSRRSRSQARALPLLSPASIARFHAFTQLLRFWLKHRILVTLGVRSGRSTHAGGRRERVYVDASFATGADGEIGSCGIGVWLPRRGIAIALQTKAKSSMEAEILALLAGAIAAKRFDVARPIIFSDCKSAVRAAKHLLNVDQTSGLRRRLVRLAQLSTGHRAYGHIFDTLQALGGSLEWRPREDNREADLASNIGARIGAMGILLSGAKNRNHALNDVLSLASRPETARNMASDDDGLVRQRHRSGTRTVRLPARGTTSGRAFLREAPGLIARLSAEVA